MSCSAVVLQVFIANFHRGRVILFPLVRGLQSRLLQIRSGHAVLPLA